MYRISIYLVFLSFLLVGCKSSKLLPGDAKKPIRFAFYNVENLFDTEDDPATQDEEFLPTSDKQWTPERCREKMEQLDRVVAGMGYPAILGLAEVENEKILREFVKTGGMKKQDYKYIHYDSPDQRGIDVALIYRKPALRVINHKILRIHFPPEVVEDYTTRDILYVKGRIQDEVLVHIFINHWPSRRGGVEESEPKRLFVARQLRRSVDSLFRINANANIIIAGDFNDEPDNKSLTEVLQANPPVDSIVTEALYNCAAALDHAGQGTYAYRGNWNMLDQIIVSGSLLIQSNRLRAQEMQIFQPEWATYPDQDGRRVPNRSFGGPNYYGGFSDHFPVYLDFRFGQDKK